MRAAKRHDPGNHTLIATDIPADPNDNTRTAVAPVTVTGIQSLTITDANNPKTDRVTVSTPEDCTLPVDGDPGNTDQSVIGVSREWH